jgi:hypothetical protein
MPNAVLLLVYLLAVARVVRLITSDRITERAREAVIMRLWVRKWMPAARAELPGDTPDAIRRQAGNYARQFRNSAEPPLLVYMATCPWCVSVYAGAVAAPMIYFWGSSPWLAVPALALALSYGVGFLASKEG